MFSSLLRRASRAAPRRLSDESRPFRVLGVQQIAIGGPGARALHHVGLWVDKLPEAVAYLEARGVDFVGGENAVRRGAANCDIAFIHPKGGGQGVLVELVQAPPAVRTALAEVEAVAGAGTVVGLWYSEEDWPATEVAPYKIALDDGPDIYAPLDDDLVVRAAKDE
ncbi:hypothetical protein JL722_12170 [Aureococcus anophagefferens]|nr:hypothetical protein JL722_12170 [Aureococcus anophagefferens]